MRALLAGILSAAVLSAAAAGGAPAGGRQAADVFGGLGTWVDIYDGAVFAAPERTAARIAARGVRTVWVETANDRAPVDVVRPAELGRFVEALHARGLRVVGWYLPGHVQPSLDVRRTLAMLRFTTPAGQRFDGVALDIESTRLRNAGLRSRRAVALARRLRAEADLPVALVPFNPRGLERRPTTWPGFPWSELAQLADAFAPMVYTGGALRGFDATYGYVTRALRLLRLHTGNPKVPIHVAGGVADRLGPEELAGFAAAVADDGATIGVSLYDWQTTRPAAWRALAPLTR
ncbi:MAG TPA: hypothetical protein VNJ53_12875 [Gaiellaceae bacterium]|nr:hypothetical protein [Gaiellaceae bacterium]